MATARRLFLHPLGPPERPLRGPRLLLIRCPTGLRLQVRLLLRRRGGRAAGGGAAGGPGGRRRVFRGGTSKKRERERDGDTQNHPLEVYAVNVCVCVLS